MIEMVHVRTVDGVATLLVGLGTDFAEDAVADTSVVLYGLADRVMWIEWIEASERGRGYALMSDVLRVAASRKVGAVGLQVVPPDEPPDSPLVRKIASFYERFGFVEQPALAPWSEYPVMIKRSAVRRNPRRTSRKRR